MTVDASSDAAPPTNPTPLLLVPLHVLPVPKPLSRPDSAIELSALDFQPTDGTQKTAPSWSARWMPGQLSEPATPLVPGQLVQTQFQYVVPNYVEG